ncbi:rhodanese-like domain-containing protein [Paludibacterium denitrificans]|uniref:Rhodanese-like domain-containing protein n=1 Tax=Paludibacterium denitrificans TaxID=2675226 RepID=A0A844GCL2_9NEIS|nr:rhodanese-like domain-containing protein [Paludibacterium denitrificans]MTD33492.1 rhodanese-like domain-containing protein [Paludibacterium denitrificans]
MGKINELLAKAKQRAQQLGLPYSGALTPPEANEIWQSLDNAVMVDVRSAAEWQFVGTVPGALCIEFKSYPGMVPNPHFKEQLQKQVDKEAVLMFLCRSGARSDDAARPAAEAGYSSVYNVLEGFEGDKDAQSHRGTVCGWKAHGLPWEQG